VVDEVDLLDLGGGMTSSLESVKNRDRYVARISAHARNGNQENEFRQVKSSCKSCASSVEILVEPEFEPRISG
jgi:hypothetical protein